MMSTPTWNLYRENTPAAFWRLLLEPIPSAAEWEAAIRAAATQLPPAATADGIGIEALLFNTLGEGQFGQDHWQLSPLKRAYYAVKPLLPRAISAHLRRLYSGSTEKAFPLGWPVEDRYARFQWEVVRQLLRRRGEPAAPFIHFWPEARPYAFVLTHDVETGDGQAFVRTLADLDATYGFRSSFNFVPEKYRLDWGLMAELRERGFEVGLHGLKHDGKLFRSKPAFMRRAQQINRHLRTFEAVGFRSPLTHRNPEWMQALDIEYDLSFFDTDPYEPQAGGTMSLWPFSIGRFLELPYTLVQDYTLTAVLKETTPEVWLKKVDFIRSYSGLALVNAHPDYLRNPPSWQLYEAFLRAMRRRADFWHALPREVARWWRARSTADDLAQLRGGVAGTISVDGLAPVQQVAS
jgi:peptidoglycan/xylan/chitin deacetylase (PgdA/CDA1 family)